MKKGILVFLAFFTTQLLALSPQDLHATFLLTHQGRELEAKEILANSFSARNVDVDFIADQFVSWISKHPSQMEDCFNESAYHAVNRDRYLAKRAILNYFSSDKPEVSEFAGSFVNWGIELLELDAALSRKGGKK